MHVFTTRRASRLLLLLCVLVGVSLCWVQQPPPTAECTIVGAPFVVGGPEVTRVFRVDPGPRTELVIDPKLSDGHVVETRVRLSGNVILEIERGGEPLVRRSVVVYSPFLLYAFLAVFALVALLLPYALAPPGVERRPAWCDLLSEQGDGYSLARVQLLLWSVPVAVIYGAASVVNRSFMSIDTQLQILLGLSGATTFISTAASPAPADRVNGAPAALSDMVSDWDGQGDVSRFQYLLLSLFGVVVVVVSFLQKLELPQIPTELLWLVGGSQATYIATKAVKQAQRPAPVAARGGPAPPAPPTVVGAPGTLVALAAAPTGEVVSAPVELGTTDGSIRLPG